MIFYMLHKSMIFNDGLLWYSSGDGTSIRFDFAARRESRSRRRSARSLDCSYKCRAGRRAACWNSSHERRFLKFTPCDQTATWQALLLSLLFWPQVWHHFHNLLKTQNNTKQYFECKPFTPRFDSLLACRRGIAPPNLRACNSKRPTKSLQTSTYLSYLSIN